MKKIVLMYIDQYQFISMNSNKNDYYILQNYLHVRLIEREVRTGASRWRCHI